LVMDGGTAGLGGWSGHTYRARERDYQDGETPGVFTHAVAGIPV